MGVIPIQRPALPAVGTCWGSRTTRDLSPLLIGPPSNRIWAHLEGGGPGRPGFIKAVLAVGSEANNFRPKPWLPRPRIPSTHPFADQMH